MKLILVPGAGGTAEFWQYQTEYFPDAEAINLPGHPLGELCTSIEDYTDWLWRYILKQGYSPPVLAGHSMGGAIVQMYALKYPRDVAGLVLIGTGARLRVAPQVLSVVQDGVENLSVWVENFLEVQFGRIDPVMKEKLVNKSLELGAEVQLSDMLCCDEFDIMDKVDQIEVPTLILCGSEDEMTPPKYSSYLAARIKGSDLTVIDGGAHFVFVEKPEAVNQAIEQFVDSL
ncbi:MAG: alpha/beta hydrolase [Dehalococcoidia bacterium]|nr:MAG: alpha/beta hydrolase [Dehalococcoidia bacterium]